MIRKTYIDYLRVLAILAVITIHVTGYYYAKFADIDQISWWFSNLVNSTSRFAVPLFVMISGVVLLGKPIGTKEFYAKRGFRIFPAIVFWSLFFLAFDFFQEMNFDNFFWMLKIGLFSEGKAYYHLWYLSMYVCLMFFVPFINQFINGAKPSYSDLSILMLLFISFFTLNTVAIGAKEIVEIGIGWFTIFPWYIAYFIMGYYIDKHANRINLGSTAFLATLILLFVVVGAILNFYAVSSGILQDFFVFNNTALPVFIITALIFLLVKKNDCYFKQSKIITRLSEASFGMYLIHPFYLYFIRELLPNYNQHALLYIPITVIATFMLSYYSILLLRRNAVLRKFC